MRRIEPHLIWIGHAGDGQDLSGLYQLGIQALVQLAFEEPLVVAPRELLVLRFPLLDGSGNPRPILRLAIRSVSQLIRDRVPTLVCCSAGMSRSPAVVAAALAQACGSALSTTLVQVTKQHPADVSPLLWNEITAAMNVQSDVRCFGPSDEA